MNIESHEDTPLSRSMKGKCPCCGKGMLFASWLKLNKSCAICNQDFTVFDTGDAATYTSICIVGTIVIIGVAYVEVVYQPEYWVHAALWIPITLLGSILSHRLCRAFFIADEYKQFHQPD
jgi:uncharacterized protein (DUF983 family)